MQIVTNIDEETYKKCKWKNNGVVGLEWWERAIANGTPIPDNATNGDVIKALFKPNWIRRMDDVVIEDYEFDVEWWKAPYKTEMEGE